ncbi:MAG: sugar ABC transporter substrate-binding protein [Planctomycetes bacterium]|nr:sugar ABC transporter substrate-binding protein [Planctomycetota bacterium]
MLKHTFSLALAAVTLLAVTAQPLRSGETLRMVCVNHLWTEYVRTIIPEFEKEHNVRVEVESYVEDVLTQKIAVEFASGVSTIDVFTSRTLQDVRLMTKNGWYVDLRPLAEKEPGYDLDDFNPGAMATVTIDGFLTSIPTITEMEVLYYRKDLLQEKGVAVPTTFQELQAAAEKLTDRARDISGFASRGQRNPMVTQFSSYLYGFGSDFQDQNGNSAINTPEFLEAVDFYGTMLRKYGPEGVHNMSWPQIVAIYNQGKVAMFTDASSLYGNILDPSKGPFHDKTGVAVFPAGPRAHKTFDVTAWSLAIYSGSKNQDLAWKLVNFLTNKENSIRIQGEGMNPGARLSAWSSPAGTRNFPAEWAEVIKKSGPLGVGHDRPQVTSVTEARDIVGEVLAVSIEGKDFRATAMEAHRRFQTLIDREK